MHPPVPSHRGLSDSEAHFAICFSFLFILLILSLFSDSHLGDAALFISTYQLGTQGRT